MNTSPQLSMESGEVLRSLAASAGQGLAIFSVKVLVVDDYVDAAESTAEGLRELGYQAEVAHDGPSALAVAFRFRPDVCLLDLGLPVMDGYEVARHLRESPHLPEHLRIIAVTGYGQEAARRRTLAAGFDAHLVKPVDLEELALAVKRATAVTAYPHLGHA